MQLVKNNNFEIERENGAGTALLRRALAGSSEGAGWYHCRPAARFCFVLAERWSLPAALSEKYRQ